jgi:hypothetical protein
MRSKATKTKSESRRKQVGTPSAALPPPAQGTGLDKGGDFYGSPVRVWLIFRQKLASALIRARNAGASTEFRLLRFLEGTHQVHDNGRAP